MKVREAYVSGRFYPRHKQDLDKLFEQFKSSETHQLASKLASRQIIGGVVPHAGYSYSGPHAFHFFEILKRSEQDFDTVIIVNPNHTGYGENISLDINEAWETPYGLIEVDLEFQKLLHLPFSTIAHKFEHSGEVILPFLKKFLQSDFKIVPISILQQNHDNARKIAGLLHQAVIETGRKILVIASSDFSHHVSPEEGARQDQYVLNEILKMNAAGVYQQVLWREVSMCGYAPVMTLIEYAKLVAKDAKCEVLRRGHSGETANDSDEVVDYIAMLCYS